MGVLDIFVGLLDQFEIIVLPVGMPFLGRHLIGSRVCSKISNVRHFQKVRVMLSCFKKVRFRTRTEMPYGVQYESYKTESENLRAL